MYLALDGFLDESIIHRAAEGRNLGLASEQPVVSPKRGGIYPDAWRYISHGLFAQPDLTVILTLGETSVRVVF